MKHIMGKNTLSSLTSVQDEDVQPNAVDLRVAKIFRIEPGSVFEISNEHKKHRRTREIQPDADGYLYLEPGHYEVIMENIINVGANEAGWVITRSTLNRNGLFITSGLYDSGYHGAMAGALHVTVGSAKIKKGTRIGQYLCFDSESVSMYNGDYGLNKAHDKKYE